MYRAPRTLLSQPIISGFTSINAASVNTTPTMLAPAQSAIRGRKRSAEHLETPPPTSKKPKKVTKPRQLKQPKQPKQKLGLENQENSRGFPRTKVVSEEDGTLLCKHLSNQPDDGALRQEQASRVSAELSKETLSKLNTFRFGAARGGFEIGSTSHCRTEPGMRPTVARPTLAIDTNLIVKDSSVGSPMIPTHQAAEELLLASTEFHRASEELGQAHSQNDDIDGYEQMQMLPIYASSDLGEFPRTASPDVNSMRSPSSATWGNRGGDEELLSMFTNHDDLESTPVKENCLVPQTPCRGVSPATRFPSLPNSETPDASNVGFVERQQIEAMEDEFPVEDEELCDMMQLPVVQELFVPALSFQCPSDVLTPRRKLYDTTPTDLGAGSGQALQSKYEEDGCIPTSAQIVTEANSSPASHRQTSHLTDLYARGCLRSANDIQMNSDQQSDDLKFLNQNIDSYFPDTAESSSDDEYGAVSSSALPSSPKLPSNTASIYIPVPGSSSFTSVEPSTPEMHQRSVAIPTSAQPRSSQETTPTPPYLIEYTADGSPKPFVRPEFPTSIRDRSPILGLSPRNPHRTCFRIGEALNAASAASRTNIDALIELYARVTSSTREEGRWKQHFEFADLFSSEKPPFLSGTYDLWRGVPLWESDSRAFLGEDGKGRLARVVGRITRDEESRAWRMRILNVWAAGLEDVAWVKGIVCA